MALFVQRLHANATTPTRLDGATGYQLFSSVDITIMPGDVTIVATDIAIALPKSTYGRILVKPGMALKKVDVINGLVDYEYHGPVGVMLINHGSDPFSVLIGDVVALMVIEKHVTPYVFEVAALDANGQDRIVPEVRDLAWYVNQ